MRWLPREGRLWLAVAVFTAASLGAGYLWGRGGGAEVVRLTPKVTLPTRTATAWEAPPSRNLRTILRANGLAYVSMTAGLVTAGLATLATYGWAVTTFGYGFGLAAEAHVPGRIALAMFAPHMFFEVLSFAFVAVIGARVLWIGIEYLRSGRVLVEKGEPAAWGLRILLGFALMVAAAAVEAYVTPSVIRAEIRRSLQGGGPR